MAKKFGLDHLPGNEVPDYDARFQSSQTRKLANRRPVVATQEPVDCGGARLD